MRIKELRKEKGIKQIELCKVLGISQGNLSNWENDVYEPDKKSLLKMADYFGVSVDYLLGRESLPIDNAYVPDAIIPFPVIGEIRAGYGGEVEEYGTGEFITIPIEMLRGRPANDYFVLQVKGNSMYPKILDGDKVLVLRTESVDSGSIAIVLYNGNEATIKKVVYTVGQDWLDLVPINPEYETKHIVGNDLEQCRILGRAVSLIRTI